MPEKSMKNKKMGMKNKRDRTIRIFFKNLIE
jgi:hypothetical protein